MRVVALGVGEAFDERYPTNSYLVQSEKTTLLLDCGYSVPQQLWKFNSDPDFVDEFWFSHGHDDHILGLRPVLARMLQDGRKKPIKIICPAEIEGMMVEMVGWIHAKFKGGKVKELEILGVLAGEVFSSPGLDISFASTEHSAPNLAIRISGGKSVVCYSGDGQCLSETEELYQGADLLIQEGYVYDECLPGHESIVHAIQMAERVGVKRLALSHMQRNFRKDGLPLVMDKIKSDSVEISIPEPMDEYVL